MEKEKEIFLNIVHPQKKADLSGKLKPYSQWEKMNTEKKQLGMNFAAVLLQSSDP